jgi:hypothetical protein
VVADRIGRRAGEVAEAKPHLRDGLVMRRGAAIDIAEAIRALAGDRSVDRAEAESK